MRHRTRRRVGPRSYRNARMHRQLAAAELCLPVLLAYAVAYLRGSPATIAIRSPAGPPMGSRPRRQDRRGTGRCRQDTHPRGLLPGQPQHHKAEGRTSLGGATPHQSQSCCRAQSNHWILPQHLYANAPSPFINANANANANESMSQCQ